MKLTYTKKELQKEAQTFALYYGREELMSNETKNRYDEFLRKLELYKKEKGVEVEE